MRRYILLLITFIVPLLGIGQQVNQKMNDPKEGEILVGNCDRAGLEQGEFGIFFSAEYNAYKPDKKILSKLSSCLKPIEIRVILGTWCSDSREQVPRLFKILDKAKFDNQKITLVCVDSEKKAGSLDISSYDIKKVPTIIFSRDGKEVGRIIETPTKTLEKDMLTIVCE